MIDTKTPRLIQIYQVKKGKAFFVCSCGRLASVPVIKYNKSRRCVDCEFKGQNLLVTTMTSVEYAELFNKVYTNGLLDYMETIHG